jgi:multiple sugar transport system permease protein
MTRQERRNLGLGLAFISPWIIGFLALCLYPLVSIIYFSLCDYSVLSPAVFVGTTNYVELYHDDVFWKSLTNTLYFAGFSIPISLLMSLFLAILLNFNLPGKGIFRTIYFLPSLVPMVCLAVLWQWMLSGELGLVNILLRPVLDTLNSTLNWMNGTMGTHFAAHFTAPNWLQDARYAKWGIIFTSVWGLGQAVVIYLAGLQDVPRYLYESAEIDGANFMQKTWHITIPTLSPVIYFNTIMALIGSFQVFAVPYVMTQTSNIGGDGPERSLLFMATYLYQNAFDYWNMGYACAIGLVLFLIILTLTYLATKLSERHIYYAGK